MLNECICHSFADYTAGKASNFGFVVIEEKSMIDKVRPHRDFVRYTKVKEASFHTIAIPKGLASS
jgi:hypothetical protein